MPSVVCLIWICVLGLVALILFFFFAAVSWNIKGGGDPMLIGPIPNSVYD